MQKVIYYRFKKNYVWLVLNVLLLVGLLLCCFNHPACFVRWEFQTLIILAVAWLAVWVYKYLFRLPMAIIDDESIKIDHTNPLKWTDIAKAQERIVRCCGSKKRIIALVPKDGINYKYNFLQRHNGEFTPFSIPLYGILSPEDEEEIIKIIAQKVGLERL